MWVRLPADVELDVLAALSEAEALPVAKICRRPPLAGQTVDPTTVHSALEHLRRTGRAVRWFADAADDTQPQAVYRRVA